MEILEAKPVSPTEEAQGVLRHPHGDEMSLTLILHGAGGQVIATERLRWEDGQKGEIPTAFLMRLVIRAREDLYKLSGEWRLREAPLDTPPAITSDLGHVRILGPATTPIDRSESRRVALQLLYEIDCAGHSLPQVLKHNQDYAALSKRQRSAVRQWLIGVIAEREQLDESIRPCAPDFPLEQLAVVDRNILRLALYEMRLGQRSFSIIIDEAVSLADLYGSEGAIGFVNGVLGTLADRWPQPEQDA